MPSGGNWKELHEACISGNLPLVKYHIKMGVDPNYQHPEFLTSPFLDALREQQVEVVEYLLQHGADPSATELWESVTAFEITKATQNQDLIQLMLPYANDQEKSFLLAKSSRFIFFKWMKKWKVFKKS